MVASSGQLSRLPEDIKADITTVMEQMSVQLPNVLGPLTPVDTGHMRQSWKTRRFSYQVKLRNTAFYSDYVENGTKRMKAQPTITPMLPTIEGELERAITTGTDFYLRGGAFTDRATQLKNAYKAKYGKYGSQGGHSG
jgi:hypothetical protein